MINEKVSYYKVMRSRNDKQLHLGFDYTDKVLKMSTSPYLFNDNKRSKILEKFEKQITFLINYVKVIKKTYNYTVPKDYIKFN